MAKDKQDFCTRFNPVWMNVKDHDLAASARQTLPGGIVHKKEALVGMFDSECAGKFGLTLAPCIGVGTAGVFTRFAEDIGRGWLSERAVVI